MTTTRAPRPAQGRVVVFGLCFDLPYAGIVAQLLQYLIGLRALGWDVWYVEDSLAWPYDPAARTTARDPSANIAAVARTFERHGFGSRWIYRCAIPDTRCIGGTDAELRALYRSADLALNVCGAQEIREQHQDLKHLVYVQSDPFGLQVDIDNGDGWARDQLLRHDHHFTFGELIGTPSCGVPTVGVDWLPTRQPVVLDLWPVRPPGSRFTTVTTWRNDTKHKVWRNERYFWSKDREFLSMLRLPTCTGASLELAVDGTPAEAATLRAHGWRIVDRPELAADLDAYMAYIVGSKGEFTVARDQVVRPRTGWFSDRSAAYLAAGRPVVTQDTGFGEVLPTGEGLFAFSTVEEAAAALDEIERDPTRHAAAARAIASEHFSADLVLASLLARSDA